MQKNKVYDAFNQVRATDEMKERAKQRVSEMIAASVHVDNSNDTASVYADNKKDTASVRKSSMGRSRSGHGRFLSFAAAAAVLALVLCLGSYRVQTLAAAYVSVDVNPSIELTLNRFNHVICAEACNDDGQQVLDTLKLKGKPCEDAVRTIMDCDAMQSYLTDSSALTFTVISDDEDRCTELQNVLESFCRDDCVDGTVCEASSDIYEEAHEHGLSFGKYQLYLELAAYDSAITPEDCHDMTMEEMENEICSHESGCIGSGSDDCNSGDCDSDDCDSDDCDSDDCDSHESESHESGSCDSSEHASTDSGSSSSGSGTHHSEESHSSGESHHSEHDD